MKKLPIDKEERIKVFTEQITLHETLSHQVVDKVSLINYSDIELLANERRIYFIVEQPVFTYTYIEDSQIKSKNVQVQTMLFNNEFFKAIDREYRNGKLFTFYSLRGNMIRGVFIDNVSDYIIEDRDRRIDDLLTH